MTTIQSGRFFTLSDFDQLIANRTAVVLDASVLSTIALLLPQIEIPDFPTYTPRPEPTRAYHTTLHKEKDRDRDRDSYSSSRSAKNGGRNASHGQASHGQAKRDTAHSTGEDWELMRSFKTTKMETKTGVDKTINDIRVHLNKMSLANYEKQRDVIVAEISKYMGPEFADTQVDDISKIASAIFDIASGNKFFSELYAELYKELVERFSAFSDILARFVDTFPETVQHIEYVDSDADYDGFCRVTKQNDKRKATTTFLMNAMKKGLIPREKVLVILCGWMDTAVRWMGEPDRIHHIEEIAENIFVVVSSGSFEFREYAEWKTCVDAIARITQKIQPQMSMSNRVLFKFMDMGAFTKL